MIQTISQGDDAYHPAVTQNHTGCVAIYGRGLRSTKERVPLSRDGLPLDAMSQTHRRCRRMQTADSTYTCKASKLTATSKHPE